MLHDIEKEVTAYEDLPVEPKKSKSKLHSNPTTKYVVTARLNLRKGPSFGEEVIRIMEDGEHVNVHFVEGEWAKTDDGYCCVSFLKKV